MPAGDTRLFELTRKGLLVFSGTDAQSFLHAQLSCDVTALANGTSTYGAYCTPQGRILASFLLWRSGADYFMQLPALLCAPIYKRLSMYILRSKVRATDVSQAYLQFGISGSEAENVVQRVLGPVPKELHEVVPVQNGTVVRLGEERFLLVTSAEARSRLQAALSEQAISGDEAEWEWLDIRAGIPWITSETQSEFIPQMVNLDRIGGVSFSKGCYPGQEIVARTHYRGQVKQRMHLVHIVGSAPVVAGDKLYSADVGEQTAGMIVNAAAAPAGGYDALAVIQNSSAEAGDVRWRALDGPQLEFLPLPYSLN